MDRMDLDIVIIGGGASGLMLAANLDLASSGRKGIILEKTARIGTKLLMSGGGRCNITHGGSIKDFINCYGESGPGLRKCLYRHSNADLVSWMEAGGMALTDEKGNPVTLRSLNDAGRVFPASMKASDILNLLTDKAKKNGWEIRTEAGVYDIIPSDRGWTVKVVPAKTLQAKRIVIACGGVTFPETGSDGSVFEILSRLGISITPLKSALAPVRVRDYPYEDLSGISISGVTVTAFSSDAANTCKGKAARMTGDLLFTHKGFSGPVILNISRYAEPGELIRIQYNKDCSELPKRLQRILENRSRGPSGDIRTTVLASFLDHDDFTVISVDEGGMVTAGGVSLDELDISTMQLREFPGLFAIGEAIDADGITGGYNLQMCWSTARSAADALSSRE